jgi:hypothetical protein
MVVQLNEGDIGVGGADKGLGDRWHGRQARQSRWGVRGCGRGAVQGRKHPVDAEGEGGR